MKIQIQNLDENNSINLSANIGNQRFANESNCYIDFSNLCSCTPSGVLLTSSVIKNFQKKNPKMKINFHIDKENISTIHASNMRFFSTIDEKQEIDKGIEIDKIKDQFIPITKFHFYDYTKSWMYSHMTPLQYIEYEARTFARALATTENQENLLAFIINEIMRNSEQHAGVDYVWICGQNFKDRNIIEIAILDEGIGYKRRLEKIFKTKINSDEKAIKMASRPIIGEVHSNNIEDEENEIGVGMHVVSEICNSLKGSFSVVSGNTAIIRGAGSTITKKAFHKGSFVKLVIDTSQSFVYKDLVGNIFDKTDIIIKNKLETLI